MKIALLVPDGIGIRNYLYSGLLDQLDGHEVHVIHRLPPAVWQEVTRLHQKEFANTMLPDLPEDRYDSNLRKICMYGRLHLQARIAKNRSIKKNWLFFSLAKGKQKWLYRLIDFCGAIVAWSPAWLTKTESALYGRMMRSASGKKAVDFLNAIAPDLVLCTHQRSVEAGYVMTAARHLNIATSTVIFSWDNLPKSRINYLADEYLVWSEWMKKDLLRFYQNIDEKQVVVTGTPQFDFYRNTALVWSDDKFRDYYHIPQDRKMVCFSGNEPSFPSDHLYLRDLLEDLKNMEEGEAPIIIVRPSPADHTSRFADIVKDYPNHAVLAMPDWKQHGKREWDSYFPTFFDSIILTNLVHHCSAVINVGSTMGLDFAHTNKPALYIRYNHPDCAWFDLKYGYQQEHFKCLQSMDAVVWIDDRSTFADRLISVLHHPGDYAKDRLKWKQLITDDIIQPSARIAKSLIFTRQAQARSKPVS